MLRNANFLACIHVKGRGTRQGSTSATAASDARRGQIRLFADFFQSDIIVASPIALATRQAEAEADAPEELDFLASVEIVVAARCDAFLMQNWAHLVTGQPTWPQRTRSVLHQCCHVTNPKSSTLNL